MSDGRYHQLGAPGVWYASDQEQAAWSELMRHFLDDGVDPFEVRRRVGRVSITALAVLDLTDLAVRAALDLTKADLTGDDYTATQQTAAAAAAAGFDGILAPSAALPGRRTLVVFASAAASIREEFSTVRQPPPRLADLLRLIRPHPDTPHGVRDYLARTAALGSAVIRARHR
jgi:RES domain-containing protein